MKKIYVIGALASLYLCPTVDAQQAATKLEATKMETRTLLDNRHSVAVDYNTLSNREVITTNDFSDAADWTIATDGQGEWDITTETEANLALYIGDMASATADNGFGQFSSIEYSFTGSGDIFYQESTLTLNEALDCSAISDVLVTFNQRYRAFNVDETYIDVSTNMGADWVSYPINDEVVSNEPAIQGEISVNITQTAANQPDVRIRFRWKSDYAESNPEATQEQWNNFGGGYGWCVDDLIVGTPPENELVIGTTWYDDFWRIQTQAEFLDTDLLASLEYNRQPKYALRPFNFSAVITNAGLEDQTGVQLVVTLTDPDGTVNDVEISSTPITLTAGATDTVTIAEVIPSNWNSNGPIGTYTMDFVVVQDQMDELPGNNVGVSLATIVTDQTSANGAVLGFTNSATINMGSESGAIHGQRMSLGLDPGDETMYAITAIQFAVEDDSEPGEQVLLNIRGGSVLEEESADNPMELFFPYDQEDEAALVYTLDESEFTTSSTVNWITYEIPPILVEADRVYQGEMFIPDIGGVQYCSLSGTRGRASYVQVLNVIGDPSGGPQGWWVFVDADNNPSKLALAIRFVTDFSTNVEDITVESGIKLVQNYPNPVKTETRIQYQFDETSAASLEVYDMSGKLVFGADLGIVAANTANTYMFNRGSLASGVYAYSIVTEGSRVTRKMVIE